MTKVNRSLPILGLCVTMQASRRLSLEKRSRLVSQGLIWSGSKVDLRVDLDWLPVRLHLHYRLAMTSSV